MFLRAERAADPSAFRRAVDAAAAGASAVLLCIADQPSLDLTTITDAIADVQVPVIGGVFPALLHGTERIDSGAIALGIAAPVRRAILQSTFEPPAVLASMLSSSIDDASKWSQDHGPAPPTMIVLVDGQAPGSATSLLDAVRLPYLHLGASVIGGGAGSGAGARPCLFTEQGVLPRGGGLVLRVEAPSTVAFDHGWTRLAGPYYASRASQTTIEELDWRSASEVYAEAIGAPRGAFSPDFAKQHPIAVLGLRETMALRDPVALTATGGLYTLGHIPQHALIAILRAEPDALIGAAGAAARAARAALGKKPHRGLVFDCVSRVSALGDRFGEELARIQREFEQPIAGALTLGEIASTGARGVEFHNKTVVVAAG